VALWSQKLDGDLTQIDCATMEKHVAKCPACSTACDALKEALLACQRVRTAEVPPKIQARVKAAMRTLAG
jgi:RNA polymerase sigma-70 factor (ECF subfamily)